MQAIDFLNSQTLPRIEMVEKQVPEAETQTPDFNILNNNSEYRETLPRISNENKDNSTNNKINSFFGFIDTKDRPAVDLQTSSYIDFNTAKFVKSLIDNLNYCLKNGMSESIFKIAEIKDQIELYKKYFLDRDENSVFLNSVDLIVDNNNWDRMSNGQIKSFIQELARFEDGKIDWGKLWMFSQQIERLKINILSDEEKEKEKPSQY